MHGRSAIHFGCHSNEGHDICLGTVISCFRSQHDVALQIPVRIGLKHGLASRVSFRPRKSVVPPQSDAAVAASSVTVDTEEKGPLGIPFTWQKIIPLGFMFFCILFNYTILRDTKVQTPDALYLGLAFVVQDPIYIVHLLQYTAARQGNI